MRGRLIDISFGVNRKQRVTVEIDGDFRGEYDNLKDKELDVEIKKHRQKRSLDANAYCWTLIDKIAAAMSLDKLTVYREAIRDIGGVTDIVCTQERAVESLISAWQSKGIGWQAETMPSKIDGCVNVLLHYGSSTYSTKQMSLLIDQLVYGAKKLDIETETPERLERYKEEWNRR